MGVTVPWNTGQLDAEEPIRVVWYRKRHSAMRGFGMRDFGLNQNMAQTWQRPLMCDLFSHLTHECHTERELSSHHAIRLCIITVSSSIK